MGCFRVSEQMTPCRRDTRQFAPFPRNSHKSHLNRCRDRIDEFQPVELNDEISKSMRNCCCWLSLDWWRWLKCDLVKETRGKRGPVKGIICFSIEKDTSMSDWQKIVLRVGSLEILQQMRVPDESLIGSFSQTSLINSRKHNWKKCRDGLTFNLLPERTRLALH